MFDDKPPVNLPTGSSEPAPIRFDKSRLGEPEDIFQDVEPPKVSSPSPAPVLSETVADIPETPSSLPQASEVEVKPPLIASRKVIVGLGVIVGIAVVAGIVLGALRFIKRSAVLPESAGTEALEELGVIPEIPALPEVSSISEKEVQGLPSTFEQSGEEAAAGAEGSSFDSDGDGLMDEEELNLGTDTQNPDSDNDGLFDGEEVQTYGTDPLDPNTDDDNYLDGEEVSNGYNPKGEGKLFVMPSQ